MQTAAVNRPGAEGRTAAAGAGAARSFRVMKAVVLTRTGGPEVLKVQEWPDPAVGAGEVRIAVRAAGLNFADTMARVGFYPAAPKTPCVLGYEVAGEVETIGADVSGFVIGQRVMAGTRFGGQAELATAQARDVMPMPDNLSFEEGAAFPVSYGTAYAALIIMGGLRATEPGTDPLGRRWRWDRRDSDRSQRRRGDLRYRIGGQAQRHPGSGSAPSDRLPQPRFQGRSSPAHRRRGCRHHRWTPSGRPRSARITGSSGRAAD